MGFSHVFSPDGLTTHYLVKAVLEIAQAMGRMHILRIGLWGGAWVL